MSCSIFSCVCVMCVCVSVCVSCVYGYPSVCLCMYVCVSRLSVRLFLCVLPKDTQTHITHLVGLVDGGALVLDALLQGALLGLDATESLLLQVTEREREGEEHTQRHTDTRTQTERKREGEEHAKTERGRGREGGGGTPKTRQTESE